MGGNSPREPGNAIGPIDLGLIHRLARVRLAIFAEASTGNAFATALGLRGCMRIGYSTDLAQ